MSQPPTADGGARGPGRDTVRIGVDIGGTFTDVALETASGFVTHKLLTDHGAPDAAIVAGILAAADKAGVAPGAIGLVIHGTTLVTNALIERRGARTAFVTTEGFRDVIEMRSENRFEQYDLNLTLPEPLVPRQHRFTVPERIGADGTVRLPLTRAAAEAVAVKVAAGDFEAVAVGFLHAYANDAHERLMAEALRAAAPSLAVSLSSAVSPRMRELARFNTVCANAYVLPLTARYLTALARRLADAGIAAEVVLMHSGGGLIGLDTAIAQPVRLLESGPAGGAIFAAGYARAHGIANALSFDMGGTTAKICLIEDGTPKTADTFEVARTYRFKKGSGMVVSTPVVEMVEIGAGGGSIASIDRLGRIAVGPRSAGSEPGPAAYRLGGTEPTVTDANLVLGRLDPNAFAGGAIALAPDLAAGALEQLTCGGLSVRDAAFGVTELVDEAMANAARVHAVENGRDIARVTVVAFGGGAPLHACRLAEKLGAATVLVPPGAGVGSAIGFLRAPFSFEATRGLFQRLDAFDVEAVNAAITAMQVEARAFVAAAAGDAPLTVTLTAHMRYTGQGWEIPVPLPAARFTADDGPAIRSAFEAAYAALFGRTIEGLAVEVTNWALAVATQRPPVRPVSRRGASRRGEPVRRRRMFDAGARATVDAAEVPRDTLCPGDAVDGPAVITEAQTSTIVTPAFVAVCQDDGALLITRQDAS